MAMPAGRKGVRPDQVDWQGKIIGGGGGSELTPRVEHLESQIGTFEFLVQGGVAGYKKAGADTFHPFRRVEEYTVTHSNTVLSEVTRQNIAPDVIFSYITSSTSNVQNDVLINPSDSSVGAHGTTASAGGTQTGCLTMSTDYVTKKKIISHRSFSNNFFGTFNVILIWL